MTPSQSTTQIPLILLFIAIGFRAGTFLLWPTIMLAIVAGCGFAIWSLYELGSVFIPLFIIPIIAIGICIYGAYLTIRSVVGTEAAVSASKAEYPELWSFVSRIASEVGSNDPDNIIVGVSGNFYVTQAALDLPSGLRLRGSTCYLSAPLMRIMTSNELEAVLGHEFSHFTGRDTLYSTHVAPGYRSLQSGIQSIEAQVKSGILTLIVFLIPLIVLHMYRAGFSLVDNAMSRRRELRCDEIASRFYGQLEMSKALVIVVGYGTLCSTVTFQYFTRLLEQGQIFVNYPEWFAENAETWSYSVTEIINEALTVGTGRFDSHPALKERLNALRVSVSTSLTLDSSTSQRPFSLGIDGLEKELTQQYGEIVAYMMSAQPESEAE